MMTLAGIPIGAALQYLFGRTLETRKQLILQKGQAFTDYFKALSNSAIHGETREVLALGADSKTRICVYGSPAVVKCLADFERVGAAAGSNEGRKAITKLIAAMRKDIGFKYFNAHEADIWTVLFGQPDSPTPHSPMNR